ncbi:hypothetical protein [Curtobacterium sp. MCPF17_031]|uniref:hypothetical protein n=1 Tax=Curtobacterium sp. MCPF17_031 TaxID=2175653 RepID=UPI000DA8E0B8|nr:hypothetical protein [Curtobacterium sp. MCPF17_031]PZE35752.1 hypothetical protein DEJ31_11400 [Curtobacterium sp. MCPF17_031]
MNDEITAAAFRQAFREADGLDPLALPDAEVVGSHEADVNTLRDALWSAPWVRVEERREGDEENEGEQYSVWPTDGVQVNFFFSWGAPIEFDFDLREMVDDEAVDGLVRLLRLVSSAVGKDVVARAEGQRDGPPVLRVDAGTGCVVLSPLS